MVRTLNRRTIGVTFLVTALLLLMMTPGTKAAAKVRVGLSVSGSAVEIGGSGLLLDATGHVIAQVDDRSSLELTASGGQVWLSGASFPVLHAVPSRSGAGSCLQVNGKPYRGDLVVSAADNRIRIVNELDLEEYLLGVVPLEMSPSWPLEALKAQAVAARTFALRNANRHQGDGFGLCDTSHCQVYGGVSAESTTSSIAVKDTAGLVLKYNGGLIDAYFHASSGGRTETAGAAWGHDRPYLTVVEDELELSGPYASWQESFSPEELGVRLAEAGYPIGPVQQLEILERTPSGRAASVSVRGSYGTAVVAGTRLRQVLNLKSTLFNVQEDTAWSEQLKITVLAQSTKGSFVTSVASGTHVVTAGGPKILSSRTSGDISRGGGGRAIVLKGRGYGHGVGLSQWGAKVLAENELLADKDFFTQILTHYYKGVTIEPYSF